MAKSCTKCGKQLPLLHKLTRKKLCSECAEAIKTEHRAQSASILESVKTSRSLTEKQIEALETFEKEVFEDFFEDICADFIENGDVNEQDFETLLRLKQIRPKDIVVRLAYKDTFSKLCVVQLESVERSIVATHACTVTQLEILETFNHKTNLALYKRICEEFLVKSECGEREIQTLDAIQQVVGLIDLEAHQAQVKSIKHRISAIRSCTEPQLKLIKTFDHEMNLGLYTDIRNDLLQRELNEQDLQTLRRIQQAAKLNEREIQFEKFVKPYYYVNAIRNEHTLPIIDMTGTGAGLPILRRGEVAHYGYNADAYDVQMVVGKNLEGTPAVNYRIVRGANFGPINYVEANKATKLDIRASLISSGYLVITNNRVLLHPSGGRAPISINLRKILNFSTYGNGIQIWKEGRKKPYLFAIPDIGAIQIFGLCLMFLLDSESRPHTLKTRPGSAPERSRQIPRAVKTEVWRRDTGRCVECGSKENLEYDHIIPVAKGGSNTQRNVQLLCEHCNRTKHAKIR